MSESRLVKLKDMKKEIFPFILLSCEVGHRRISDLPGLHKAVASRQGQGFIPRETPHAFPLTHPRHTLLNLKSKPLFFKQSFTVSIHLFRGYQHTHLHRLSLQSCHSPFSPHGRTIGEHHQSFRPHPSSFRTTALSVHSGLNPFSRYPANL